MTKKQRFLQLLRTRNWTSIHAPEWTALQTELADISPTSLRKWLTEAALPIAQPYAGIATKTLLELEQSLASMAGIYIQDPALRKLCRAAVIQAKDRARFASLNLRATPEKRALKEEMLRWMLVWLDDPALFQTWLILRKNALRKNAIR